MSCGAAWDSRFLSAPSLVAPAPVGMTRHRGIDKISVNIKVNVKGNGQECPFHTGGVLN